MRLPRLNQRGKINASVDPWMRLAGAILCQAFKDAVRSAADSGRARWWLMHSEYAELYLDAMGLDQRDVPDVLGWYN